MKYVELNAEIIQMLREPENNFFCFNKYTSHIPKNKVELINFVAPQGNGIPNQVRDRLRLS